MILLTKKDLWDNLEPRPTFFGLHFLKAML